MGLGLGPDLHADVVVFVHGVERDATSGRDHLGRLKLGEADKTAEAKAVGKLVGELCKKKGIAKVVFDRNGYIYHGRIKALADAARETGLQF